MFVVAVVAVAAAAATATAAAAADDDDDIAGFVVWLVDEALHLYRLRSLLGSPSWSPSQSEVLRLLPKSTRAGGYFLLAEF